MTEVGETFAFQAFETQLQTLCLKEFPCGIGSWRENTKRKTESTIKDVASKFAITLKDYGPSYEKTETLEELVRRRKSPWNLDYSWSDEAKQLREIAVRSPWLIDENFVLSHFKTLRIVDRGVTNIDGDFMKFRNLEELTLSANKLKSITSRNLPQSLKVLEVCANEISSLTELCVRAPPLDHLGLGHNQLAMVDDYITGHYWPNLLSLDFAFNNLCDLLDIVKKLQTLPKLRNLVLQGNPISLVPAYRGYTIDSLRALDFLDDVAISADEKHHFKGLARRKEYILDEAKTILTVEYIKGIPQPEELSNPEDQPEFPVINRKYFVEFMFLADRSFQPDIFGLVDDDLSLTSRAELTDQSQLVEETPREDCRSAQCDSVADAEKNVSFAQQIDAHGIRPVSSHADDDSPDIDELTSRSSRAERLSSGAGSEEHSPPLEVPLAAVKSEGATWEEEIKLDWSETVVRDDLLSLRNFVQQGMEFRVVEETILSYAAEQTQDEGHSSGDSTKGKDSKGKGEKKEDKKKDKDDGKDKKKKKKGEPEVELVHMPAECRTLGTFHVTLSDFLEGSHTSDHVYTREWEEGTQATSAAEGTDKHPGNKDKKEKKKEKPSSAKKKDPKDSVKTPKKAEAAKDGGVKGSKSGGGPAEGAEDDTPSPPPPLEVHVVVRRHHWRTALDSLKEERMSPGGDAR